MITKEMLKEKIDALSVDQLDQVYGMIELLNAGQDLPKQESLMAKLQQISVDASINFSVEVGSMLGRDVSED